MTDKGLARLGVLRGVSPGWILLLGIVASLLLFDRTEWSAVPFLASTFLAVALLRRSPSHAGPKATAKQSWFEGISKLFGLRSEDLRDKCAAAGLNTKRVLFFANLPWWLLLGFWVLLVAFAIYDFSRVALVSAF